MVGPSYLQTGIDDELRQLQMQKRPLTQEEAVAAAISTAAPAIAYAKTPEQMAEDRYYAEQTAISRQNNAGKEAEVPPYPGYLGNVPPVREVELPPEQPLQHVVAGSPPYLQPEQPQQAGTRLATPCDYGMCEGLSTMGETTPNRAIWSNGTTTVVRGPGPGGRSRLSELAGAGFRERNRMTPQVLENQNRGAEVERLSNAQRDPLWTAAYTAAFAKTNSPEAAAAAANNVMAAQSPETQNIYARYQARADQTAVNQAIDRQNAQSLITGDYTVNQALGNNAMASAPSIVNAAGNPTDGYSIDLLADGGSAYQTTAKSLNDYVVGAGTRNSKDLWALQQHQQQQALNNLAAQQSVAKEAFDMRYKLGMAEMQANAPRNTGELTAYQEQQLGNAAAREARITDQNQQRIDLSRIKQGGGAGATGISTANNQIVIDGQVISGSTQNNIPNRAAGSTQPMPPAAIDLQKAYDNIWTGQATPARQQQVQATPARQRQVQAARPDEEVPRGAGVAEPNIRPSRNTAGSANRAAPSQAANRAAASQVASAVAAPSQAAATMAAAAVASQAANRATNVRAALSRPPQDPKIGWYPWGYEEYKDPADVRTAVQLAQQYDPTVRSMRQAITTLHNRDLGTPSSVGQSLQWPTATYTRGMTP